MVMWNNVFLSNRPSWPIDGTLKGIINVDQGGPMENGNEGLSLSLPPIALEF